MKYASISAKNFHAFDADQKEYILEYLVSIYTVTQDMVVQSVLIYDGDTLIGSYDDNGLVIY